MSRPLALLPVVLLLGLSSASATLAEGAANVPVDIAFDADVDMPAAVPPAWEPLGSGDEPTSLGRAIVGYDAGALPSVLPGQTLLGLPVAMVSEAGSFLVVYAKDLARVRAAFEGQPGVAYVEDDGVLFALATPNDPKYSSQYGPGQMGFPTAWDGSQGYGSSSVTVAVLDTGILRTHSDFTPSSRFLAGWDYVNNDGNPNDDCGHGTHVIGTVAATTANGLHVAGMSQATILPMKVLGPVGGLVSVTCSGSHSIIAQAIHDAKNQGADVISMSLGGSSGSSALQNAVDAAWNAGVLVVAAAGNDGASNSIDYPAAYANAIAVGATTNTKARASYSDMGSQLEIMGSGSNIISTSSSGGTTTMSGTSMATPHVAGALALALSCAPAGTTAAQVRSALQTTAEDLGATGRDTTYGFGLARADDLVSELCSTTPPPPPPPNQPPSASFTASVSGLTVTVTSTSSDPEGDAFTETWSWGDGTAGSTGTTASHTYAAAGTYTIGLTVANAAGSDTETAAVTVASTTDPDPSTPNLVSGTSQSVSVSSGGSAFYKIEVPAGSSQLKVDMTGPSCGLLGCSFDADLYTRYSARPTDTAYDCRPYSTGSVETCTHTSPAGGWWYVRVKAYSGSGTVTVKASVS